MNRLDQMETQAVHIACLPASARCRRLVGAALELIANKWAVPVILMLYAYPSLRNSDLKNAIDGISAKELAKQLRLLESSGIIGRKVHPTVPPQVEYWLTELGMSLHPILDALGLWAAQHGAEVERNRNRPAAEDGQAGGLRSTVHRMR